MGVAWYTWRASWRKSWREALVIAVIGGLLGAVALGALAGARRTDTAYDRYLASIDDGGIGARSGAGAGNEAADV